MSPTSCQTAPPRARYRSGIIAVGARDCQTFLRCNSMKSLSLAASPVVRTPGIAECAQRLQEHDQIGLLALGEMQRFRRVLAAAPQALRVQFGIVTHCIGESLDLAVVPVRRG